MVAGPEGGSQDLPALTATSLVAKVCMFGGETGFEGCGFCTAVELVVDDLGAGQTPLMGVVVGEGGVEAAVVG